MGLATMVVVIAACSVGDGAEPTVLGVTITSLAPTTAVPTTTATTDPPPAGMPKHEVFLRHRDAAEVATGESFLIDPRNCRRERWAVTLTEGLAWVVTSPRLTGQCDVWLGGGADEGAASEVPSTYCGFHPNDHPILIVPGRRGPVRLDDPNCGPTGFDVVLQEAA